MEKFKTILFPVDLSPASPELVPYAKTMAEKFESEIHLLFVARRFQHLSDMYVPEPEIYTFERGILEGAERRLDEFKDTHFMMPANIKTAVLSGDPAEEIITYTQTEKVDMIVMGTHGRKGLNKIVFGSVAERVVKRSPVPVFIVNPYKTKD